MGIKKHLSHAFVGELTEVAIINNKMEGVIKFIGSFFGRVIFEFIGSNIRKFYFALMGKERKPKIRKRDYYNVFDSEAFFDRIVGIAALIFVTLTALFLTGNL